MVSFNYISALFVRGIKVIYRQYKLYLLIGILIALCQLYSGYFLYKEIESNLNSELLDDQHYVMSKVSAFSCSTLSIYSGEAYRDTGYTACPQNSLNLI